PAGSPAKRSGIADRRPAAIRRTHYASRRATARSAEPAPKTGFGLENALLRQKESSQRPKARASTTRSRRRQTRQPPADSRRLPPPPVSPGPPGPRGRRAAVLGT